MKFLKEKIALRGWLMLISFVLGLALVVKGWAMTGELAGLIIMLAGVGLLLLTLFLYNKPFEG